MNEIKGYENFVIRNVGSLILLVNIKTNEIFEIDNIVEDYLNEIIKTKGLLNMESMAKSLGCSVADVRVNVGDIVQSLGIGD